MNDVQNDEQYRSMIRRIRGSRLPALPRSAAGILELSRNPENGPSEFADAISSDAGLTAQILRFVNSSYFGFRGKITTIRMALSLVYGRTIRNFILWNAVFALLPNPRCGPFTLNTICQDSLRRGMFAKIFGGYFPGPDPEELFLRALLQDVALPILAQNWPDEYREILHRRETGQGRISDMEREMLGWDHALAGAFLVGEWGFDDEVAEAVLAHTRLDFQIQPENASRERLQCAIVSLSSLLPSVADEHWTDGDRFFDAFFQLRCPGIPYPDVLFEQTENNVTDLLKISRLGAVTNPLPEQHKKWLATLE